MALSSGPPGGTLTQGPAGGTLTQGPAGGTLTQGPAGGRRLTLDPIYTLHRPAVFYLVTAAAHWLEGYVH